jgi:hypothetical protein
VQLRTKNEGRGVTRLLIFHDLNFAADSIKLMADKARARQRPKIVKQEPAVLLPGELDSQPGSPPETGSSRRTLEAEPAYSDRNGVLPRLVTSRDFQAVASASRYCEDQDAHCPPDFAR